jgi:hypothetical protein
MARKRNYGQFTTRRRAALKKAQFISARKRKGRRNTAFKIGILAAGVGAGVVIGQKITSHKNTPGGSEDSYPMGTDPSKNPRDIVAPVYKDTKRQLLTQNPTSRLRNKRRTKTPAQQTGGVAPPVRKAGGTPAARAALPQGVSNGAQLALPIQMPMTKSSPSVKQAVTGTEVNSLVGTTAPDWESLNAGDKKVMRQIISEMGDYGISSRGVIFQKNRKSTRRQAAAKKAAATRRAKANG